MTTIIDWPSELKNHRHAMPWLEKNVASSGASLSGVERVLVSDAGRWRYGFSTMIWNKKSTLDVQRIRLWRAFITLAEGRGNIVRVPINDTGVTRDITPGAGVATSADNPSVPHSDGSYHSDLAGYDQPMVPVPSGGRGATTLKVTFASSFVPMPGHFFSVHDRLYAIKTATVVSGSTYQLTFAPRLRLPVAQGSTVNFETLTCLMRLSEESLARVEQGPDFSSNIDLDFTEAITS
jgi:hypothetical protein